jgi:hypothetical protein
MNLKDLWFLNLHKIAEELDKFLVFFVRQELIDGFLQIRSFSPADDKVEITFRDRASASSAER